MYVKFLFTYLIVYCLYNFEVYSPQIYFINGKKVDFISIQVKDIIREFSRVISVYTGEPVSVEAQRLYYIRLEFMS